MAKTKQHKPLTRERIRELLKMRPGSQTEVAELAGVTRFSVSNWLAGRHNSARLAVFAEGKAREIAQIKAVK